MVLGILGLLIVGSIPTVTGVAEAISAKQQENAKMKEKIKFNTTVTLSIDGGPLMEAWIVLAGGRVWIDHPEAPMPGHKFNGYYFKYPTEQGYQGLVSTIQDDPPMLNWLYADKDTGAMRYGSRIETAGHFIGPWGWSEDEEYLTMDGDDWRFIAVEEEVALVGADGEETTSKFWSVYLSRDRDGDLKPKAEKAEKAERAQKVQQYDDDEEDERLDVRLTKRWAPIRLQRKLQLGVNSGYVKGPRGQSSNVNRKQEN